MGLREDQTQRLVAIFFAGALLLTWPLLALFNRPSTVLGIPLLVLYLFGAWALTIGLMAWAVRPGRPAQPPDTSS
jgi:hypothetical protein